MTIKDFFDKQIEEVESTFRTLDTVIRKHDKKVTVEVGSIMGVKEALVYKQENVFKYGLTSTNNHFSYHSMIMYVYPEILEDLKEVSKDIKFQKGCFNFKTLESISSVSYTHLTLPTTPYV